MNIDFQAPIIKSFKEVHDEGYRCILYEIDEEDNQFTVHLKNFEEEKTRTLKCDPEEGLVLKSYIDRLS